MTDETTNGDVNDIPDNVLVGSGRPELPKPAWSREATALGQRHGHVRVGLYLHAAALPEVRP